MYVCVYVCVCMNIACDSNNTSNLRIWRSSFLSLDGTETPLCLGYHVKLQVPNDISESLIVFTASLKLRNMTPVLPSAGLR